MSWGFSPPTGLALGRSPFRSNPFLEGGSSAGSTNGSNGGGGSGGNNVQGGRGDGDWTFLDERATSAPSSIIPPPSLAQERRRSMSLDIPQSIPQQQHQYPPPPPHHHHHHRQHHHQHQNRHRSSSSSCSPSGASSSGGRRTSNLTRDLSGLNVRERGESAGLPIRGGSSSSSSEGSEAAIQRQYRSRLEEADQKTAYWQARAKEAEQAILKYKQECVTLRCQLSGKQCTLNSLDEVMGSIVNRLESVLGNLGIRLEAMSPSTNQPEYEGAGVVGGLARELERKKGQSQARPLLLGRIEMGLQELEQRVGQGRGGHVSPSSSFHLPKDSVINFRRLAAGDLALFFPTPAGDYLAFNVGCPHHYLSEASKAMIGQDKHFRKYYVLGRITKVEKHQAPPRPSSPLDNERNASSMLDGGVVGVAAAAAAGSNNKGSKASTCPSNLSAGCKYTIVHVEPIGDAHHQQSPQLKGLYGPPIKTL